MDSQVASSLWQDVNELYMEEEYTLVWGLFCHPQGEPCRSLGIRYAYFPMSNGKIVPLVVPCELRMVVLGALLDKVKDVEKKAKLLQAINYLSEESAK